MITINRRATVLWTANIIAVFFVIQLVRLFIIQPRLDPITDSVAFLMRMQQGDGSFVQDVSFLKSSTTSKRGLIQAKAVYGLMRSYQHTKNADVLYAVEKGLNFLHMNQRVIPGKRGAFIALPKEKNIYPAATAYGLAAALLYQRASKNNSFDDMLSKLEQGLQSAQRTDGSYPKILGKKSTDMGNVWATLHLANQPSFAKTLARADRYYFAKKTPSLTSNILRVIAYQLSVKHDDALLETGVKHVTTFLQNNRKNPLKNNCETLLGFIEFLPIIATYDQYVSQHARLQAEVSKHVKHLQDFQVTDPMNVRSDHFSYTAHGEYTRKAQGGFMKTFDNLKAQVEPTQACLDLYLSYTH